MTRKKAPKIRQRSRAPRGEGSVFPDSRRGGYRGKVQIGHYANGDPRYKEVWAPTHAECVERKKQVRPPDPNSATVAQLAAAWLAQLDVASSTRAGYERQVTARIVPDLGHHKARELTADAVWVALVGWKSAGTPTANRTRRVGATMFNEMRVSPNPFSMCKKLKYEPKPLDPFTPAELRTIIEGYRTFAASPLLSFLAATGARVGEASALDIADYDRVTGRVSITKTWCVRHGSRKPKSKHSRRVITVPAVARPAVEHAIGRRTTGPLFAARTGSRYDPGELGRIFDSMLARLGLRRRNIHQMRHGVISAALANGIKLANVARDAGDTVQTIVKVYVHPDEGEGISEAMDRLFSGASPAQERP